MLPPRPISPTRDECVIKPHAKPRKRAHNWKDGLIVRYDSNGKNPQVLQDSPPVMDFAKHEYEDFQKEHPESEQVARIEGEISQLSERQRKALIAKLTKS